MSTSVIKQYSYLYKIIVLGMNNTGKTTICNNYSSNNTSNISNYEPTIGIDFHSKILQLDNTTNIKINFWDTAGQEIYRSLIQIYYHDNCAAILVYDITNRKSFYQLTYWINELNKNTTCNKLNHNHPILLLGNKCDLSHKRMVSLNEVSNFAILNNCIFAEVSMLSNTILCKTITDFVYVVHNTLHNTECTGVKNINKKIFSLKPKSTNYSIPDKNIVCFCNIL